jgi:hypothetical protein
MSNEMMFERWVECPLPVGCPIEAVHLWAERAIQKLDPNIIYIGVDTTRDTHQVLIRVSSITNEQRELLVTRFSETGLHEIEAPNGVISNTADTAEMPVYRPDDEPQA